MVIENFKDKDTERLFNGQRVAKFEPVERRARRKLRLLDLVVSLKELNIPSNRLEKLRGDRQDQYSIRINRQYRICFNWFDDNACDVQVVDYHS